MTNKNQTLEIIQETIELKLRIYTDIMVNERSQKQKIRWFDRASALLDLLHDLDFIELEEWGLRNRKLINLKCNIKE